MARIFTLFLIFITFLTQAQVNRAPDLEAIIPPPAGIGCPIYGVIDPDGDGYITINLTSFENYVRYRAAQSGHNLAGYSIQFYYTDADRTNNNPITTTNNSVANNDAFYMKLTYVGGGPQVNFVSNFYNCYAFTVYSSTADNDQDGIPNLLEDLNQNGSISDDDTDGIFPPNFADNDDDNDGILTINEDYNANGNPADDDMNGNGIPDYLDNSARGSLPLNLRLFLEGYYTYSGSGMMQSVKFNQDGVSPLTDVENITVELHKTAAPYELAASTTAMLKTNGNLACNFPTASVGSYYIVIKSRNGIETWSATPQSISTTALNYNFTNAANKAYGNNLKNVGGGFFAIYSGDVDGDGLIDPSDYSLWEADSNQYAFGNYPTDFNGDGLVDPSDYSIWETNSNNFTFANKPE